MDNRSALKKGTILHFPGMECCLQEEIGRGSNAVVYRGWYEDALTRGSRHHVLVKELFPLHPKGMISRGEDGGICVSPEAQPFWEVHLNSFLRGNRAHLALLESSPDAVGGNLNTFTLGGTHYTVMDCTGGRSLEMAAVQSAVPLKKTVRRMLQLLHALDAFHRQELVHLDVSPDNALLIGQDEHERIILIDYNSAHTLTELKEGRSTYHSIKPGYTAPEVRVPTGRPVGFAADLYSAAAVFFFCLTGRSLTPFELTRKEPPDVSGCEALRDAPDPVLRMVRTILHRGLNALPAKRYQTIADFRRDLEELIDRIDGVGVTHWALWEAGRQQVAGMVRMNPAMAYIREEEKLYPSRAILPDGTAASMEEAVEELLNPGSGSALLLGHGGLGKTTALLSTACRLGKRYSPAQPAAMYISLYGWQSGDAHYVTDRMLEYLRFRTDSQRLSDARHALRALMEQPLRTRSGERPAVLLLIDGLNETPADNAPLLQELAELASLPGVRMLVASRTENAGLKLPALQLAPLTHGDIVAALSRAGLAMPESPEVMKLLSTPLMLSILIAAAEGSGKQLNITTAEELLSAYFDALQEKEERDQPDNAERRWQTAAAVKLVLPAVAAECGRRQRALTAAELLDTLNWCRQLLSPSWLRLLFPDWVGHSREILGGTQTAEEWLGLMVQKILWQRLGLLLQDRQSAFRPSHQELAEYLVSQHSARQKLVRRRMLRQRILTVTGGTLAAAALIFALPRVFPAASPAALPTPTPRPTYEQKQTESLTDNIENAYYNTEQMITRMQYIAAHPTDAGSADLRRELKSIAKQRGNDQSLYEALMCMFMARAAELHPEIVPTPPPADGETEMLAAFAQHVDKGAYTSLPLDVPWSRELLDVDACWAFFALGKELAEEYPVWLDMLTFVTTDDYARSAGYDQQLAATLAEVTAADAQRLVGLSMLSNGPHVTQEILDHRLSMNGISSAGVLAPGYTLYFDLQETLPEDPEKLWIAVHLAENNRRNALNNADYLSVDAAYRDWLKTR